MALVSACTSGPLVEARHPDPCSFVCGLLLSKRDFGRERGTGITHERSRRAQVVKAARVVRCLRVRELKLARRGLGGGAKHSPVAWWEGHISRGDHAQARSRRIGETKLKRAVGQS